MAKFNEKSTPKNVTVNHMGEKAFIQKPEFQLVSILLTSFMENSYYETSNQTIERMKDAIKKVDPKFAAKAAVYARNEFGMRSVSHVLAVEMLKYISGQPWGKNFFEAVVRRPDDMSEIIAYYFSKGNEKLPSAIKRGFAKAFGKFDKYQIAKYKGKAKEVSLVDVVNLVHPTPTEKNSVALKELVEGTLKNDSTWESKLTKAGQDAKSEDEKMELKANAWKDLFDTNKMPYMALLRNLRNILEQAPELTDRACEMLVNRKMIENSLVLPFRFISAHAEIEKLKKEGLFEKDGENISKILKAIDDAAKTSVINLPVLQGKTIILSDNSGSMTGDSFGSSLASRMSNIKTSDIANLFAVLYWMKADNTLVGLFGDHLIYPNLKRNAGVFENFKIIDKEKDKCGGATERGIFDMFEKLTKEKIKVDTIVVFSDCQIGDKCLWFDHSGNRGEEFNRLFEAYKSINPDVRVYSVDLKGYGNNVFNESVIKISGWSDKIFDIMKMMEQDKNALIQKINEYVDF